MDSSSRKPALFAAFPGRSGREFVPRGHAFHIHPLLIKNPLSPAGPSSYSYLHRSPARRRNKETTSPCVFSVRNGKIQQIRSLWHRITIIFSKWQSRFVRQLQICDATWQANSYKLCTALGMVTQDLQRSASDSTRGTLPRQMDTQLKTSLICLKKTP